MWWSTHPISMSFMAWPLVRKTGILVCHLWKWFKRNVFYSQKNTGRRMQPSRRLERAGWVVLAMVFGILPFAPLIVAAMEALPGLALTSMLTEQLGNFGKGTLCRSFQAVLLASMLMAKGWIWNRVLCKVPRRNPILSVFKFSLSGSTERFQSLSLWHVWMLKWKKVYWNVGWHMLRLNPGTVLMKVFVQTWAFLGCICLVSPMNAWGTLRRAARAVLAKKRMSDRLQQQVSFEVMEQQQFELKKYETTYFL